MYNFLSIEFPDSEIKTFFSYRTEYTMSRASHEMVSMYIQNWGLDYQHIHTGSPVRVAIRSPYGEKEFTGYVHSVTPDLNPSRHFVNVVALGASVVMKQASQKIWTKVTADQVVTEIAKKHNFSFHATPHPRMYDHLAQTGETDWEFLSKLAWKSGYTLRAEGTSIFFDPYTKDYKDYKDSAPYFVMREANHPNGHNLYSFSPEINDSTEHDGAMKAATAVAGVDLNAASSIVVTNQNRPTTTRKLSTSEVLDRFHTSAVIPDAQVAKYEAIAADERARYPYRGKALVLGDARIKPDMPIFLDGIGNDYSGYWTVLECTHILEEMKYVTEIIVGTDSLGQSVDASDKPYAVPQRVITPLTPGKAKKPKTLLAKNTKTFNKAHKSTGFGKTNNRPQPKTTKSAKTSSSKWVGASGNLRVQPSKNNASPTAVAILRSRGAR